MNFIFIVLLYLLTFLIYSKFNKKLSKKVRFMDSILISSFIVIPIYLVLMWILSPFLIERLINLNAGTFAHILLNSLSAYLLNFPRHLIRILLTIGILVIPFEIINIINAYKMKKYAWLILMIILFPFAIIYYFLIGRREMK